MSTRELFDAVNARYSDTQAFIDRVVETMRLQGISQKKLADRAGVDVTQLSAWVGRSRRTTPSLESKLLIDEALLELVEEAAGE